MLDSLQKSNPLAILGFGELALQILSFLEVSEKNATIFDDNLAGKAENAFSFSAFTSVIEEHEWLIALGYKHLVKKLELAQIIQTKGAHLKSYIHPSSFQSIHSKIEEGVIIYPMCNIDKGVNIGLSTMVNNSVTISHDSLIGKANYISPGVIISGNVTIGNCCFIGSGTIIANGVTVGDNVIIAAGTLVSKDLPSNSKVIGNPMVFKDKINLV